MGGNFRNMYEVTILVLYFMDMTSLHNSPRDKIKDIGKKNLKKEKPQTNSKTMFSFEECEEKC